MVRASTLAILDGQRSRGRGEVSCPWAEGVCMVLPSPWDLGIQGSQR